MADIAQALYQLHDDSEGEEESVAWLAGCAPGDGGSSEEGQEAASSGQEAGSPGEEAQEAGPSQRPEEKPGAASPKREQQVEETPPDSAGRPPDRGRLRQGDIRTFMGGAGGG